MPDVLLLCEYAALNGAERSMLATLAGVQAAGFRVTVLGPPQGPLADALRAFEIPLEPLGLVDAAGKRLSQARVREQLADTITRRRSALVHANSLSMGRLLGPVASQLQVPSIAHLRDIVGLSRQAILDLNGNSRLLAVSQAVRTFHTAAGLDAVRVHVLYNGVDLEQFRPRPATGYLHQELGLPRQAVLAATIGQIGMRKGQDVLLQAAALLADEFPQLHYLIVGQRHSEKPEAVEFEAALRRAVTGPLAGRIHFLGRRSDVDRLLNELTVLVHPARQEPLGRVLLEAAAAGTPVVATDVGGTQEIFPPSSNAARLVPPDDASLLAATLGELLRTPSLCLQIAAAARHRAQQAFDARQATENLITHYRQLVA